MTDRTTYTCAQAVTPEVTLVAKCETVAPLDADKGLYGETRFDIYKVAPDSTMTHVGWTSFSPMPGCCGVVVSHGTYLEDKFRRGLVSDAFRRLKTKLALELGYSMMIATTDMSNIPAVGNMIKSRYKITHTFTNKRTGNLIGLGVKKLGP